MSVQPRQRLVRTFRESEQLAADWMHWMGFSDARLTVGGPDEGVDVLASAAVAQVKFEGALTGRPAVQSLYGVATSLCRTGMFFSLAGWTAEAKQWADLVEVALFRFTHDGSVTPDNLAAERLFTPGSDLALVSHDALGDGGQTRGGANGRMTFSTPFTGVGNLQIVDRVRGWHHICASDSVLSWDNKGIYRRPSSISDAPVEHIIKSDWGVGSVVALDDSLIFAAIEVDPIHTVVHRLRAGSLDPIWIAPLPPMSGSECVVVTETAVVVAGSQGLTESVAAACGREHDSIAWCFARETGRVRWKTVLSSEEIYDKAVSATDRFVFVGGASRQAVRFEGDEAFYEPRANPFGGGTMIDARDGQVLWILGDRAPLTASIAGSLLLLTVAEPDPWWIGYVALDCQTGRELWRTPLDTVGANLRWHEPLDPVVGDRHVWLPGLPIVCHDLFSGEVIWSAASGYSLIMAADELLAACFDGDEQWLWSLEPLTGNVVSMWDLPPTEHYGRILWISDDSLAIRWNGKIGFVRG